MWRHIGYEMFREKKERKSQKEGIRRKRETGKHSKKVCCNRVAKPVLVMRLQFSFRFAVMGNGTFHLWKVWLPMTSVFD